MEIPQTSARLEFRNTEAACADRAGESGGSAESDCARAMAQAESVVREISLTSFSARRRSPELSSSASEMTETGFRRMAQAHSAGLDAVIGIDRRDVLRFPAPRGIVADALPRGAKSQR